MTTFPPHVALVGMPGVGKSRVGRDLAFATGAEFVDLDTVIERRAGSSIPEIFEASGEAGFRALEYEALAATVGARTPLVISTGGGLVTVPEAAALLGESSTVIFLRAPLAVLVQRVAESSTERPLLDGDPAAKLEALLEDRGPLYLSVADDVIDIGQMEPAGIVDELLSRDVLGHLTRVRSL